MTGTENEEPRKWLEYAYLNKENWPEAIPPMGPKREYGPQPWWKPSHDELDEADNYQYTHPAAASIGDLYMGDVCPWCGVPLRYDETVTNVHGTRGELYEVSPDEEPVPCFHVDCWEERMAEIGQRDHQTLEDFTEKA